MSRRLASALAGLAVAGLAAACAGKSPAEKVAELRTYYTAEVNQGGFLVDRQPGAPGEAASADVTLDVLLRNESPRNLAGLTLDIAMVSPAGQEKGRWRLWVDTSTMVRGPVLQLSHRLEDVPYQDGDRFSVEVRHPIPEAERGEYREFSQAPR